MATQSRFKNRGIRVYGPGGPELVTCKFTTSGTTSDVTTVEAQGCTVARTGVGVFVVTFGRTYKVIPNVTFSVQASTTAQLFIITAATTSAVTITQVTAGGGTAVDTLAATINVQAVGRTNS